MILLRCLLVIIASMLACVSLPDVTPVPQAQFSSGSTPGPSPTPGATLTTGNVSIPVETPPTYLSTFDGHLYAQGANLTLHGIGWWGWEANDYMVGGFDQGAALTSDFAMSLLRLQILGFNAVRLPMAFSYLLNNATPPGVTTTCSEPGESLFLQSVGANANQVPPAGWALAVAPTRQPGVCNGYLPTTSALDRYAWMVQFLAANNFYVMIDDHIESDSYVPGNADWVDGWVRLAESLLQPIPGNTGAPTLVPQACQGASSCASLPPGCSNPVCEHLLLNVISTAHNGNQLSTYPWDSNSPNDAHHAYLAAMDALATILPHALFVVEGAEQPGLYYSFGTGVSLDPTITLGGAYDPHPFFDDLVQRSYVNQVVLGPAVFGPSITSMAGQAYSGSALLQQLHAQFDLLRSGYGADAHIFPVVPVAFGATFNGESTNDEAAMQVLAGYINDSNLDGWFYWAWPFQGLPMGLQTNSVSWAPDPYKINFLQSLNLQTP